MIKHVLYNNTKLVATVFCVPDIPPCIIYPLIPMGMCHEEKWKTKCEASLHSSFPNTLFKNFSRKAANRNYNPGKVIEI
jgi:hypothetical protein